MTTPRGAYCRVLTAQAYAQNGGAPGNECLDILSQSRAAHTGLSNAAFWAQATLSLYTPMPEFHAAHCLLADTAAGKYPVSDTSGSSLPTVKWSRVSGSVNAQSCLPDGSPAVHEIKILDSDPAGRQSGLPWAFQTVDLGEWKNDADAAGGGSFGKNRGIGVTVKLGSSDTDDTGDTSADGPPVTPPATASDGSSPGDVRVTVGNIWSVLFPAGSDPVFEQRFPHRDEDGTAHEWVRLHTFAGAQPLSSDAGGAKFLVTFFIIAGRLLVNCGGRSLAADAFVYYAPDPSKSGNGTQYKTLTIASAPVRVTGRAGGGPRWIGLRRIVWGTARMQNALRLQDATVAPASFPGPPTAGEFVAVRYAPALGGDVTVTGQCTSPTLMTYTAVLTSSPGGQEPSGLKQVFFHSPGQDAGGNNSPVDYGGAVTHYRLHLPEPNFSGTGTLFGSRSYCEVTFDSYELDKLAAAAGSVWQRDLAAYAPATFVTGSYLGDSVGNLTTEEGPRILGYWEKPSFEARGFNDNSLTLTLSDASILLHEPAAIIDTSFRPLDLLFPAGADTVYGYHGVQYILGKCISQAAAQALKVFMPQDWYSLTALKVSALVNGEVPTNDLPLFAPPYGKSADEWLADIQAFDFAAFYWAGETAVYGQYDLIVAGLPAHDAYTGQDSGTGLPSAMPLSDTQLTWIVEKAGNTFDTAKDFNDFLLQGRPPGAGDASTQLGVPPVQARARDAVRISQSWQRTKLISGAMFYDPDVAGQLVQTAKRLSAGAKAAERYEATSPFPHPALFWGHKLTFHGGQAANLDGKTLRIVDLVEEGNGNSKATTTLKLVEVI